MLPFFLFFAVVGAIDLYGFYAKKSGSVTVGYVERVINISRTTKLISIIDVRANREIYVACRNADLVKGATVEVGANWYDRSIALGFKKALYLKNEEVVLCGNKDALRGVGKSTAIMSALFVALFFACLAMVLGKIYNFGDR